MQMFFLMQGKMSRKKGQRKNGTVDLDLKETKVKIEQFTNKKLGNLHTDSKIIFIFRDFFFQLDLPHEIGLGLQKNNNLLGLSVLATELKKQVSYQF